MSFFRRRRKESDEAPKEASKKPDASPPGKPAVSKPAPASAPTPSGGSGTKPSPPTPVPVRSGAPPVAAVPAAPGASAAVETPRSPPPPLPDRAPAHDGPMPVVARPLSQCFVCGTPLEEGRCPQCQMTWVE